MPLLNNIRISVSLRNTLIVTQFKLHITITITSMKDVSVIKFSFISIINVNGILAKTVAMRVLFRNCPTCGLPDIYGLPDISAR